MTNSTAAAVELPDPWDDGEMVPSALFAGIALLRPIVLPGGAESMRFTGSPLNGGVGTVVELVSTDPCPAPVPGTLWTVYVMFVPPPEPDKPRFLYKKRFPVRSDGSWTATVTATGDQAGDATIEASCEAGAVTADYQPVIFKYTA